MPIIDFQFNGGIEAPAKLGTLILKPASKGKLSYAQNIEVQNDEYGNGVVLPGPALPTIGSNSELDGIPFIREFFGLSSTGIGYLYFGQGVLGAKTKIRRVKDIVSGSTPVIDTTGAMTFAHSAHANPVLTDILLRKVSATNTMYIAAKDDTDVVIESFDPASGTPSLTNIATNANFTGSFTDTIMVLGSDNNIYWMGQAHVDKIDTADAHTTSVVSVPANIYISAGADWQQHLAIAYTIDGFGQFDRRKSGGTSGIILWDYFSPSFEKNVVCPSKYISAVVPAPDGSLIVFGGLDEGKTTLYNFTGFGFDVITSYIGEMPRSRHSVEFDGQGRLVWQTADGQILRYDRATGVMEHLGTIDTTAAHGGLLASALGGVGNEFIVASGKSTPTYTMKRMTFGAFIGSGTGADTSLTPLAVSGMIALPPKSMTEWIEVGLQKNMVSGDKVEVRMYKNGSSTPVTLGTLDFAVQGAKAGKRFYVRKPGIDNIAIGLAWKTADAATTAPGGLYARLSYRQLR